MHINKMYCRVSAKQYEYFPSQIGLHIIMDFPLPLIYSDTTVVLQKGRTVNIKANMNLLLLQLWKLQCCHEAP